MPKYKQPKTSTPESIEQAWREQGEIGAVKASIAKYAKVLDMTDSGRDIKPQKTTKKQRASMPQSYLAVTD